MQYYNKMMKNLYGQLQECKAKLIAEIKEKYSKVFDELDKYADEVGVSHDKYAKRDITISLKTNTGNFYALQANANTTSFFEDEMKKINAAIPVTGGGTGSGGGTGDGGNDGSTGDGKRTGTGTGGGTTPPKRLRKVVHLNTHTTQPMRSEADVDLYLAGLKAELMQYINNNNDIIVS